MFFPLRVVFTLKIGSGRDTVVLCFSYGADVNFIKVSCPFTANVSHPQSTYYPNTYFLPSDNMLRSQEGDQVVPTSQRRPTLGGQQRQVKPLPPLPDPEELMSDEAADNEVEFFTSDRQRLLPKSCPKAVGRGSRECGKVNHAYREGLFSMAFSWPGREDRVTGRGSVTWAQREDHLPTGAGEQPEQHQSSRFSFTSAFQPHDTVTCCHTDKPQVPPRVPITIKSPAFSTSTNEEDVPPKIPPRVPLVPPCPPSSPSPKSLPIYINGVMPATQSFAANPKYVSKALHNQQRERAPSAHQVPPCIVPILKDGRQASATHYILLPPGRSAYSDRRERLFSEPARTGPSGVWQST